MHNISFLDAAALQTVRNFAFMANNRNKIEFLKLPTVNEELCKNVIANVNKKLAENAEGRLFAVIQLCGKQFKVTTGDILVLEGYWAPSIGDKLRLDKVRIQHSIFRLKFNFLFFFRHHQVLLVGGEEFSLIGRPLVQPGLVDVQAIVIEKTIAHTRTVFKKKRRKQYTNIKFHRSAQSMIRINSITLNGNVNENIKPMPGQNIFQ